MTEVKQARVPSKPKAKWCPKCGLPTSEVLYIGVTYIEEAWNGGVIRRTHTWECGNCGRRFYEDIRECPGGRV